MAHRKIIPNRIISVHIHALPGTSQAFQQAMGDKRMTGKMLQSNV